MSDVIKHECGIAFMRLRKPLGYFIEKYGTPAYAVNKMFLLMEKQHNRGQDGAGLATVKLGLKQGINYIDRFRSVHEQPIAHIFKKVGEKFNEAQQQAGENYFQQRWVKENIPFTGELLLGHLRYATYGKSDISACHPFLRSSNWRSRNLLMAGNFNLTNADELFELLVDLGQYPWEKGDTVTVMEKIGHFLDLENEQLLQDYRTQYPELDKRQIIEKVEQGIDWQSLLERACRDFDGGYAMVGMTGHGDAFVVRDAACIRPAYYYANDEIVVVASEKPAIKTAFNVEYADIQELGGGNALIILADGSYSEVSYTDPLPKKSCSFERIYFSRGTDPEIYTERKNLGRLLCPEVLEAINYDMENTIFSYIPNTAETAFLGLIKGMEAFLIDKRNQTYDNKTVSDQELRKTLTFRPRVEKLVIKDTKMRTFITDDHQRDDLVAHVYDTTYEIVRKGIDTLVVIDDSIVRGTTLEKSILKMLDRLEPKCIIIVSSAPQIRFPDCYGIDMSLQQEFVVFRALLSLLKKTNQYYKLDEVYQKCLQAMQMPVEQTQNHVKELYELFSYQDISNEVAHLISEGINAEVKVIFQTVENLHKACPNHSGDWYFTGNYPTKGGNRVANRAFINFMEGKKIRAY
jgi:amidophosphoribosyltransferase